MKKACFWQAFSLNVVSLLSISLQRLLRSGKRRRKCAASNAAVCDFVSHNVFNLRVCFEFSFFVPQKYYNFHSIMPNSEIFIQSK